MNSLRSAGIVLGLVLSLAACGSKVTPENYEKLESGMSRDQVHGILGKPDAVVTDDVGGVLSLTKETWKAKGQVLTVTYGNDTLALKSLEKSEDAPK